MTDTNDPNTVNPESESPAVARDDVGASGFEPAVNIAAVIEASQKQLADQNDKYLRLAAEYDNFRKRSVKERQEAELRGMGQLIRGILDALDDLGRFAHIDPATTDATSMQQGAELVEKKLLKSLAGHGLEIVNPVDQPFNPVSMEAITTAPAANAEEDHTVALVYQVGYLFNGQLLRPAQVVVKQWNG